MAARTCARRRLTSPCQQLPPSVSIHSLHSSPRSGGGEPAPPINTTERHSFLAGAPCGALDWTSLGCASPKIATRQPGMTCAGLRGTVHLYAIGIEIVHHGGEFPDIQYNAVLELVKHLRQAFGISRQNVVGHSDVRVPDPKLECPGVWFRWSKVEAAHQTRRRVSIDVKSPLVLYTYVTPSALVGPTSHNSGTHIAEIRRDLHSIGYYVGPDVNSRQFDNNLVDAVQAFQLRYCVKEDVSNEPRHISNANHNENEMLKRATLLNFGAVDMETARAIKAVLADSGP